MSDRQSTAIDDTALKQVQVSLRKYRSEYAGPVGPDGARRLGVYGFSSQHWANWSAAAGLPGADWRDPAAQDRVAEYILDRYRTEFGSKKLISTAWAAGPDAARAAQAGGKLGERTIEYVQEVETATAQSPVEASGMETTIPPDPPLQALGATEPLRGRAQQSLTNTLYTMRENQKRMGVTPDGSDEQLNTG